MRRCSVADVAMKEDGQEEVAFTGAGGLDDRRRVAAHGRGPLFFIRRWPRNG